ncbi:helitron_like_N domain-containing protein [Trichonephila clavipes]|nr:helitron_like_N domain-containing protein [Trichonephila clavipes]
MVKDRVTSDNYKVVIHPDHVPRGEHERRFNAPTTNEIAAVVVSSERNASRDIVVQVPDGRLTRVPGTHRFYDALGYPIIVWKGQEGYSFDIPLINPVTKQPIPNKKVLCKDFYAYHMITQNFRDPHNGPPACLFLEESISERRGMNSKNPSPLLSQVATPFASGLRRHQLMPGQRSPQAPPSSRENFF